jgi:DNA-binding NtrC family response regulator
MAKILIIDDEAGIRELLAEILRDEGHDVVLAESAAAARAARAAGQPDLVLLDIWMPEVDGLALLKEWAAQGLLNLPVIMMSGHATIDTAVEATRIGARDVLEKPIGMQKLLQTIDKALADGQRKPAVGLSLATFTQAGPLRELRRKIDKMLADHPLLLLRTSPGGIVELAALSAQTPGRPVLNLAQEAEPLSLEKLEQFAGGLLWCEELAWLSRPQQKNLHFAAERLARYNLRLVVGTVHDRAALAALGWDAGLLAMLFAHVLVLPALTELRAQITEIAQQLLVFLTEHEQLPPRHFSAEALAALSQAAWPGGYAELRAAVRTLALTNPTAEIDAAAVQAFLRPGEPPPASTPFSGLAADVIQQPLREAREAFERWYFEQHLAQGDGNMTRLAETTGLERTHLYRKLKDLGLR